MIEQELTRLISEALERSVAELGIEEGLDASEVELSRPRNREHGDFSTNAAMVVGARHRLAPRTVAEALVRNLPASPHIARTDIAGPGFVNFHMAHLWLYGVLEEVGRLGERFGSVDLGAGERVQVEFVSANPTGPLHVGTGRNAVIGDSLARLLAFAGYAVEREYYVNDAGSQIALFAESLEARYLEAAGRESALPEGGYHGTYVAELAAEIAADADGSLLELSADERRARLREEGLGRAIAGIRSTLERIDVRFDVWFHESTLHDQDRVRQAIELLRERGVAYEAEGAVWFAAERFGDEKDRVLVRANGEPTYFAADCAYLRDKFARGFDRIIYVWGADHHGTVKRLLGAAEAMGYDAERVEVVLTQLISLYRGGEPVRMSKRTGDIVTFDELLDEVGSDAARYTLLTRSTDTALDFDIELVTRQSMDNPVYYVQYAHARIASLLSYAETQGIHMRAFEEVRSEALVHEAELDLMRKIAELPEQVRFAAEARAPYRLTKYAEELAATFHRFYTECRVVTDDADLTQARMHVASATRQVLANVLGLLGVSAPSSMERLREGPP